MAIYDANNGNLKSRQEVLENFASKGVHVIFLGWSLSPHRSHYSIDAVAESLCDREEIITANIRSVKLSSPDVRLIQAIQEMD